jgi:hypothetical protein
MSLGVDNYWSRIYVNSNWSIKMDRIVFYETKIQYNHVRIAKVRRVKASLERLYSDISSTFLQSANNNLGLVIAELLADNKTVEALINKERLLTQRAADAPVALVECDHKIELNGVCKCGAFIAHR